MATSSSSLPGNNNHKRGSVVTMATAVGVVQSANKFRSRTQSDRIHRKRSSVSAGSSLRNSTAWNLKYKDFVFTLADFSYTIGAKSEKFNKLLEKANDWLRDNNDVRVRTCETLTWMSHDPLRLGDSEEMVHTKRLTEGTHTYYARGLRLWLVASTQTQGRAQTIYCEDFTPGKSDLVQDLVSQINKKINQHRISGEILTVETLGIPKIKGRAQPQATFWSESVDDDAPYIFALRLFGTRSVHQQPAKPTPPIGVRDMIPLPTDDGFEGFEVLTEKTNSWLKEQPAGTVLINMQSVLVQKQEEKFEWLRVTKIYGSGKNYWIKLNSVQPKGLRHTDIGSRCQYSMPGINNPEPLEFFRILRVYYFKSPNISAANTSADAANCSTSSSSNNNPTATEVSNRRETSGSDYHMASSSGTVPARRMSAACETSSLRDGEGPSSSGLHLRASPQSSSSNMAIVCYETFTPEIVRIFNEEESTSGSGNVAVTYERLEKMKETFSKVMAFLRNTGAELICAETVMNPVQLYNAEQQLDSEDEIKFLFTIRLFISGPIGQFINCSRLVRRLSSAVNINDQLRERKLTKRQSSPLFLASVVNRRFKYRWLVLAISAFTCMAIITTLSVVYSNKW